MSSFLVITHVIIGAIALLSGALALIASKGSDFHRNSGQIFVMTMFITAAMGAYIALLKPELVTVISGLLTCYLILTSWTSIVVKKRRSLIHITAALTAFSIGITGFIGGIDAINSPSGLKDGFPATPYFVFGGLGGIAGFLDLKYLLVGHMSRYQILSRHLWRMCSALLIASSALLLGQMHVFPTAVRSEVILSLPLLMIIFAMLYYLFRERFSRSEKSSIKMPPAT